MQSPNYFHLIKYPSSLKIEKDRDQNHERGLNSTSRFETKQLTKYVKRTCKIKNQRYYFLFTKGACTCTYYSAGGSLSESCLRLEVLDIVGKQFVLEFVLVLVSGFTGNVTKLGKVSIMFSSASVSGCSSCKK